MPNTPLTYSLPAIWTRANKSRDCSQAFSQGRNDSGERDTSKKDTSEDVLRCTDIPLLSSQVLPTTAEFSLPQSVQDAARIAPHASRHGAATDSACGERERSHSNTGSRPSRMSWTVVGIWMSG